MARKREAWFPSRKPSPTWAARWRRSATLRPRRCTTSPASGEVEASEADPDHGAMALCCPRQPPAPVKRVNGPFKPWLRAPTTIGNLPRLLLAWVCTEAVRTQSRELVLGKSLSKFMRELGVYNSGGNPQTRLRNQMNRLFGCTVSLIYEDNSGFARVTSPVADKHEFWWNERKPDEPAVGQQDRSARVLQRDHQPSRTPRHEHAQGPQALLAGPRSLSLAQLPDLYAKAPGENHLATVVPPVRREPDQDAG